MADVVPIHRLSAFKQLHHGYGGDKRDSESVMVIPKPDGTLTEVEVKVSATISEADETFPKNHVEHTDSGHLMFGDKSCSVRVIPSDGDRYVDDYKIKLTEQEDGLWAVFYREEGQPLYQAYNDVAEAGNYLFGLPEMEEVGLNVRKGAKIVNEEPIHEEVEVDYYGETRTRKRVAGIKQEEGGRWFGVRVRVFASSDTDNTPEDFVDDVADEVGIESLSDEPPKLTYFAEDPTCSCDDRRGTLVERHDKTQTMRCENCGGTFTVRNRREIAHEPGRY